METALVTPPATIPVPRRHESCDRWAVPVLEPAEEGPAQRFAAALGTARHPALVFFVALICGFALITGLSIAAGLLVTDVFDHAWGVGTANEHFVAWLAAHRTPGRTEASLLASIAAGGHVLPILVAATALVLAILRKWRLAAFVVFALVVESAAYRATTLVIHEHRPRVIRLEALPVNASYPSGHTAASIAVYLGLLLLLASRFDRPAVRAFAAIAAVLIPVYVGLSRMYRGMHHPLDVAGGAFLGIAALTVVVFACRAAGAAAHARNRLEPA